MGEVKGAPCRGTYWGVGTGSGIGSQGPDDEGERGLTSERGREGSKRQLLSVSAAVRSQAGRCGCPGCWRLKDRRGSDLLACVSDTRTSFQLWGQDALGASLLERDADLAALKGEYLARPHREVVPQ